MKSISRFILIKNDYNSYVFLIQFKNVLDDHLAIKRSVYKQGNEVLIQIYKNIYNRTVINLLENAINLKSTLICQENISQDTDILFNKNKFQKLIKTLHTKDPEVFVLRCIEYINKHI